MASNQYLHYEAESMLDFMISKLNESGTFTDQIYAGSNLRIILETIAAMFECFQYNLNFQASEGTFNGVQMYENMLKIVNMLGYKARASIPATILGTLSANIHLDKVMPQLSQNTSNIQELVDNIQDALITVTNPKVVSRNLSFTDSNGKANYVLLDTSQVYSEFINLTEDNIFYWTETAYTNETEAILNYLRYIWNNDTITLNTTLEELAAKLGFNSIAELLANTSTITSGGSLAQVNLRVSSSDIDNFIVAVNGKWNTLFVTSATSGEQYETYNIPGINVSSTNISDGTLYAAVYTPSDIENHGIEIYKSVSNLRNYASHDKVFEYKVDVDKTITIKFGNGAYGKTLPENKSLALFYIVNDGTAGEVAKSSFVDGLANIGLTTVVQNSTDSSVGFIINDLLDRFLYNNIDISDIDKTNCTLLAKLLSSNNNDEYIPKMDIFFTPLGSSSKFSPIETVDEIRTHAPEYNRTSDRVITKGDLETVILRDYVQYVYDLIIMTNYEYMAKFYGWLYNYNSLSKDVAAEGYKYADSCNFNDVYVWLKSYSNYPVNDFVKKTMERALNDKKVLTSELVFLDTINTYFYPYIGTIQDDIDWLIYCRDKYYFLIREHNTSDKFYKRWKRITDILETDTAGTVSRYANKKLLNYLFSGESQELKLQVVAYRDTNANENLATIKTNINNTISSYFNINNRKLGDSIKLNALNEELSNIAGIRKFQTIKSRNVNIYTDTGPVLNDPIVTTTSASAFGASDITQTKVQFDESTKMPTIGLMDESGTDITPAIRLSANDSAMSTISDLFNKSNCYGCFYNLEAHANYYSNYSEDDSDDSERTIAPITNKKDKLQLESALDAFKDESLLATGKYIKSFWIKQMSTGKEYEITPTFVINSESLEDCSSIIEKLSSVDVDPSKEIDAENEDNSYADGGPLFKPATANCAKFIEGLKSGVDEMCYLQLLLKAKDDYDNNIAIFTTDSGTRPMTAENLSSSYQIYVKCERWVDETPVVTYSNKISFVVTDTNVSGETIIPLKFKISTKADDESNMVFELKDIIETPENIISSTPQWESTDIVSSVSFCKFTNSLINARDFETIGSGYAVIEDFCFPALYKDLTSIIEITNDNSATLGIEF